MLSILDQYGLRSEYPMQPIVDALLKKTRTELAFDIIKDQPEMWHTTVSQMGTKNLAKFGGKFIKDLGLDEELYPEIGKELAGGVVRYFLTEYESGKMPLWKLEDLFSGESELLIKLVKEVES
jgi:hypothetical protein